MMIACAADEAYAEMAAVLLRSLAMNGDVRGVPVYLIGDGLAADTVEALRRCADGLEFRFIDLTAARRAIEGLPVSSFSTTIYIRLLLPDLIAASGRLLYLDCDIMVRRPVGELLRIPLGGMLAAAVPDGGGPVMVTLANAKLGKMSEAPYFNSGVLMFDLETWRDLGIGRECMKVAEARNDYWPDQDALNLVLHGRIKPLEDKWNFFSLKILPRAAYESAHILHFIPDKPTSQDCQHPMFGDYLEMRAATPWRDRPFASAVRERRIGLLTRMAAERLKRARAQK
jgi:lipopolysaccharide biosynthesis glycosyltransferase